MELSPRACTSQTFAWTACCPFWKARAATRALFAPSAGREWRIGVLPSFPSSRDRAIVLSPMQRAMDDP